MPVALRLRGQKQRRGLLKAQIRKAAGPRGAGSRPALGSGSGCTVRAPGFGVLCASASLEVPLGGRSGASLRVSVPCAPGPGGTFGCRQSSPQSGLHTGGAGGAGRPESLRWPEPVVGSRRPQSVRNVRAAPGGPRPLSPQHQRSRVATPVTRFPRRAWTAADGPASTRLSLRPSTRPSMRLSSGDGRRCLWSQGRSRSRFTFSGS